MFLISKCLVTSSLMYFIHILRADEIMLTSFIMFANIIVYCRETQNNL
jgi:hypothetical protein